MRNLASIHVAAAVAVTAVLALGCGGEEADDAPRTEAQSVVADGLTFRAPMFRQLNPAIAPDRSIFETGALRRIEAGDDRLWFAAFVQICNASQRAQPVPEGFRLVDALGESYAPVEGIVAEPFDLETEATLKPDECLPERGGVAEQAVPGAALVFRLPRAALADRPLFLVLPPEVAGENERPPRIQLDL